MQHCNMAGIFPEKPHASSKELILTAFFTAGIWWMSFTVLLPFFSILVLSSWMRDKFFTFLFTTIINSKERWQQLCFLRKKMFDLIQADSSSRNRSDKKLKFLEIGVGTGANFQYYSRNHALTLVDKNPNFKSYFETELKKYPNVNLERVVFSMAENMKEIGDEEFDYVVCTHFFCSVDSRKSVLKEVKRVLKPGGKLAFVEHIGYPKDHLAYWIQKVISPMWYVYCNGCKVDRHWEKDMQAIFSDVTLDIVYPTFIPMVFRPHVTGMATK